MVMMMVGKKGGEGKKNTWQSFFSKSNQKYLIPKLRKKKGSGSWGKKESKTHVYILSVLKVNQAMA